ncbi:MAG: TRAP transporter large permease, partial [Beijerinckiaceae bacterium]
MSAAFFWCIIALFALAGIGAPIALAMIASSILYLILKGQDVGLAAEQMIQGLYDSFLLLAIPLFIVAANIMNAGTISERLLKFCLALVGRFRGGLGHVNVVANMIFAGMSGSAVADAVGLGKIIIEMMRKDNRYSPGYAAAITAAASTIGPIIPPSIPMVMYALVSDTSIGYLFLGGFVPGVMMGIALMLLNARMARKENVPLEEPVPRRELPRLTVRAFPALLMPIILLFGIYGGATTPTEAAAIAAFYALLLATFFYRAVSFNTLYGVFNESARATASVGLVIGASLIFNYIVAAENIPAQVSSMMQGLNISPLAFLLAINVLFLVLGCLLDATTIILVIIPLFIPTCKAL